MNEKEHGAAMPRVPLLILTVWSLATIILTIILTVTGEPWSIFFEAIQLFPIFAFFAAVSDKQKLPAALICIAASALFMTATGFLRFLMPGSFVSFSKEYLFQIILVFFYFIGILIMKMPLADYNKRKRRATVRLNAVVSDIKIQVKRTSKGGRMKIYCPTYEYTYRGKRYRTTADDFSQYYKHAIGDIAEIYIDPDKPEHFTDIKMKKRVIVACLLSGGLFCLGVFYFFAVQLLYGW